MRRDRALALLTECVGNEIWSPDYCRRRGIPDDWLEAADAHESGFRTDRETIYVGERIVNQYHGLRDVEIALRLGKLLGLPVAAIAQQHLTPEAIVQAIKESVDE